LEAAMWVANAAVESLDLLDWDFFLHKTELADAAMHQCLTLADPTYYRYDPEVARAADHVYRQAYIALDGVVGKLLDFVSARNDMVLIVASDHGGGVNNTVCDIDRRLRDAGLQNHAYTKRNRQGTEIFVNLAGREPQGVVKPGEYEQVQEAIIDTLLDWRDPRTNKRAIAYALKLRDAALIGYWGPEAGDVHFCYNPGFVWGTTPDGAAMAASKSPISNHGPQIVTAATGYSSMMGQLFAWGPGVARGVARDEKTLGPIPIAGVAPTLSRLLGCRTPKDARLGPVQDMLA
ncbi:MAG: alkaline phosphatase family protein, partial [Acidobacteria bacterium]|nr:alkaline phosphatase family protein [Acidobacteriota bacterium]